MPITIQYTPISYVTERAQQAGRNQQAERDRAFGLQRRSQRLDEQRFDESRRQFDLQRQMQQQQMELSRQQQAMQNAMTVDERQQRMAQQEFANKITEAELANRRQQEQRLRRGQENLDRYRDEQMQFQKERDAGEQERRQREREAAMSYIEEADAPEEWKSAQRARISMGDTVSPPPPPRKVADPVTIDQLPTYQSTQRIQKLYGDQSKTVQQHLDMLQSMHRKKSPDGSGKLIDVPVSEWPEKDRQQYEGIQTQLLQVQQQRMRVENDLLVMEQAAQMELPASLRPEEPGQPIDMPTFTKIAVDTVQSLNLRDRVESGVMTRDDAHRAARLASLIRARQAAWNTTSLE